MHQRLEERCRSTVHLYMRRGLSGHSMDSQWTDLRLSFTPLMMHRGHEVACEGTLSVSSSLCSLLVLVCYQGAKNRTALREREVTVCTTGVPG